MIEDLYGVEKRSDRPGKRVKLDPNADKHDQKPTSKGGHTYHSSGIVGEYMRPSTDDQGPTTDISGIVDLTNRKYR